MKMKKILGTVAQWLCLVFLGMCILLSVYIFTERHYSAELVILRNQLDIQIQVSNNMAITLSQVNNMLQKDSALIGQVNKILTQNGYSGLVREISPQEIIKENE